jgi:hypothetical protein
MTGPNDYIPDWTEQPGPYDEPSREEEYSDLDELRDEEDRYEKKYGGDQ